MRLIARIALCVALCASAACTVTPIKTLDVQNVRRIGWFVSFNPDLHNVHTGITVFGNFAKPLPNDWQLAAHLESVLDARLSAAGYQFKRVELDAEHARLLRDNECYSDWDNHYLVERCGETFAQVVRSLEIDVLMWSTGYTSSDYITQGPAQLPDIGVYTRGTDRPNLLVPYANISMGLLAGNPAEPRRSGSCNLGRSRDRSPWPKDVKDMSIEDYAFLREELQQLLTRSAENALVSSGLLPGPAPVCPNATPEFEPL